MSRPPHTNRLAEARLLAAGGKLEQSLAAYAELVGREPMNSPVFAEFLAVKSQLIAARSASELMKLQHEANIVHGRQRIETLLADPRYDDPLRLERFGAKVYSQHDEDGILAEIFRRIGTTNRQFFEFGVEDGLECNTHLLLHQGWQGAWAEASEPEAQAIRTRFRLALDAGRLRVAARRVDADTVNAIARELGVPAEADLVSIDIDFNDYWVWKALELRPRVVVVEYNAKFPPPMKHVVAHNKDRAWNGSDYYGASLQSLCDLATAKGYTLVGCNITGVNAFFVRTELCDGKFATPATAAQLYQPPRYELFRMGAFEVGHPADFGLWLDL